MSVVMKVFCLVFVLHITEIVTDCPNSRETINNWTESQQKYPALMVLISEIVKPQLQPGSSILKFINLQEEILRLVCYPEIEIGERVKKWELRYFATMDMISSSSGSNARTKENKFAKQKYNSWYIIVERPLPSFYLATYSCQTINYCWHHFYVVTRPSPRTTFPIHMSTGSEGNFSCWGRNYEAENHDKKYPIQMPLKNITWKFLRGDFPLEYIDTHIINRTVNEITSIWSNTITITNASEIHAGVYECVIFDKYDVSSTPDPEILDGLALPSGKRYRGFAHVHIRPRSYIFIPIGIIIVLCCSIPLLIKFCPTAKNEADLEEEDEDKYDDPRTCVETEMY